MKKFKCPACGAESFTPLQKTFAGQMNAKGRPCPSCGIKCVNGMGSTIFHTITGLLLLIFSFWNYFKVLDLTVVAIRILIALVIYWVLCKIVDAFFFPLVKSMRVDR